MMVPVVDTAACTLCMACIEVCSAVFRLNEDFGYIEVVDMEVYPKAQVDEAIKYCPEDCIAWETL